MTKFSWIIVFAAVGLFTIVGVVQAARMYLPNAVQSMKQAVAPSSAAPVWSVEDKDKYQKLVIRVLTAQATAFKAQLEFEAAERERQALIASLHRDGWILDTQEYKYVKADASTLTIKK